jgi:hypothetical protein
MQLDRLPLAIGRIVTNLQSLEFVLRLFLCETVGPNDPGLRYDQLAVGDRVQENPLTEYPGLESVVKRVNRHLEEHREADRIDPSLVDLRDELAHGRVMGLSLQGPWRLLKFSPPENHTVRVEEAVDLTPEWLALQIQRTYGELQKVIRLSQKLGLACFPDS